MKKLTRKKLLVYGLLSVFVLSIIYVVLRYYLRPDWFDSEHVYHKVYNYQVKDIEPQKNIIKDLNVEFIHSKSVLLPENRDFKEETREIETFYEEQVGILHVVFTDDTQADILLVLNEVFGPGFFEKIKNTSFSEK